MIHEGEGLAAKALEQLGISLEAAREKVEDLKPRSNVAPSGSPPFTKRTKNVLGLSLRESNQLGHSYIDTEHILLVLVREGEGVGCLVLLSLGVELPTVRQRVIQLLSGYQGSSVQNTAISRRSVERPRLIEPEPSGSIQRVGKEWTGRVVRAGRTPPDYEAAHKELEDMLESVGIAVDVPGVSRVAVSSVETDQGPGLELSISARVEDESDVWVDDTDARERRW